MAQVPSVPPPSLHVARGFGTAASWYRTYGVRSTSFPSPCSHNRRLRSLPADVTRLTRLRHLSWDVERASTAPPSAEQLAWMASVPQLALGAGHGFFGELAKSHGITWPRRIMQYY
jgi:hypothetical protein